MRQLVSISFAVVVVCIFAALSRGADMAENPAYRHWAKFKPGAYVMFTSAIEQRGGDADGARIANVKMTMTRKLIDLTAETATVEVEVTTVVAGRTMNPPARRTEIPARIEASKVKNGANWFQDMGRGEVQVSDVQEGDEEITVLDKKLKCHWVSATIKQASMTSKTKMWISDAVPGGLVKTQMTGEQLSRTMAVTAYADGQQ